jgi:hypothetical protein
MANHPKFNKRITALRPALEKGEGGSNSLGMAVVGIVVVY